MKTFAGFIAGFLTALAFAAAAGSMTISTTVAEDTRLAAAFGDYLALGRSATGPEIKAAVVTWVKGVVFNYEAEQAKMSAVQSQTLISPT